MTDELMTQIEQFVADKVAAQRRYENIVTSLSPEQLQSLIDAATPEVAEKVSKINRKAADTFENHPLAEYTSKALQAESDQKINELRDQLWAMTTSDRRRYDDVLEIMSGPNVAMVYGDSLSEAEREQAVTPWRQALGKAAGL